MGIKSLVKQVLTDKENRRYERLLEEKKISYGDWITALEASGQVSETESMGKLGEGSEPESTGKLGEGSEPESTGKLGEGSEPESTGKLGEGSEPESTGKLGEGSEPESTGKFGEGSEPESTGKFGEGSEPESTGKFGGGSEPESTEESGQRNRAENSLDFAVLCAGRGELAADLCPYIRDYFAQNPQVMVMYGDEDVCGGAGARVSAEARRSPWFKPDWSPDLLDSFFYFGSVTVLRGGLFRRVQAVYADKGQNKDGRTFPFRKVQELSGGEESQKRGESINPVLNLYQVTDFADYEQWMHTCVELAGGYAPDSHAVGHLGRILFHSRNEEEQGKFLHITPFLRDRWEERLQKFRYAMEQEKTLVSVVILSRDHPEILEKCLQGCLLAAERRQKMLPFEVILVDNGSSPANRERTETLIRTLNVRITYLYQPQKFNFSRLCNIGAAQAEGKFLLFLNDDVELCQPGCMEWLAALADRNGAGAVGMKLYYPDSVRIQHAGITNLPMGPVHKLQFLEDDQSYYYGANRGRHNVLAVTAACLMVDQKKYREAGGFAEELEVAFNDVDFCFRLHELGYRNICVNDLYAYHYESLSRGADETQEKLERLLRERDELYRRHPGLEGADPYYSPYLNREGLDTGIRPAYFTAGNAVQTVGEKVPVCALTGYHRDACLMIRVEDCRGGRILGYGVVLGDNNACYERELLLRRVAGQASERNTTENTLEGTARYGTACADRNEHHDNFTGITDSEEYIKTGKDEEPEQGTVYGIRLAGQYRPDLEINMPDQKKAALCGFWVEMGKGVIPPGRYRIGMGVRNRVTGLKLVNWSNGIINVPTDKET